MQLLPAPGEGALPPLLTRLGARLSPLHVGVASIIFSGRLRVALKPLMSKLPIVAAMQARGPGALLLVIPAKSDEHWGAWPLRRSSLRASAANPVATAALRRVPVYA